MHGKAVHVDRFHPNDAVLNAAETSSRCDPLFDQSCDIQQHNYPSSQNDNMQACNRKGFVEKGLMHHLQGTLTPAL